MLASPLVVQVNDKNFRPVAGVPVGFVAQTGSGSVSPAIVTSGTDGQTGTRWTLGPRAGSQTVTASVPNVGSVTFTATTPVAAKLAFTVQPRNATAGAVFAPAVVVTIEDSLTHVMIGASDAVTVKLDTGLAGLSGTTTVTTVGGVATFGDLSLQKAGSGYLLTASSPGLARARLRAMAMLCRGRAPTNLTGEPYYGGDDTHGQLGN